MLDVSIIIVNYNTKDLTIECLRSVIKYTKNISYEIILVDNASSDGSVEKIEKSIRSIKGTKSIKCKVIQNTDNLGFSGGNNVGIKQAKGKYILLLNSDTKLFDNSIVKMVKFMDQRSDAGIASCKLLNRDKSVQPSGGYFPTLGRLFAWATFIDDLPFIGNFIGSYHPKISLYNSQRELDWVTGAFFLIRQEVVEKIGLLNEKFFMYVEELEYCYRAKKAGFKVFYTPLASIIHYGGASNGSRNAILGEYKGLFIFYKLHEGIFPKLILSIILKLGALLRILLGVITIRKEIVATYAQALAIN